MAKEGFEINLLNDLANIFRDHMANDGYDITSVQNDDRGAITLHCKLQRYKIEDKPRTIAKANNFECPPQHSTGLRQLEEAIQNGASLVPYRSKRIKILEAYDDLFDWGNIHHFHLGENPENDQFAERTNELLFCWVGDTQVYFIKIATHDSSPFAKRELIEIIHDNWPELIRFARIQGVEKLEHEISDDDRKVLRRTNLASLFALPDGTIYIEPGIGRTTGGIHFSDLRYSDAISRITKNLEQRIKEDWHETVNNARQLGYHIKENPQLSAIETDIWSYWDLEETESGYRFRTQTQN